MCGRCIVVTLCLMFLTNIVQCSEERSNGITITDDKSSTRIEIRNPLNASIALSDTPTVIQQGSNVYIKPKFIIGSPFTSYKQESNRDICCQNDSVKETIMVTNSVNVQNPPIIMPPIMLPPLAEGEIVIPTSRATASQFSNPIPNPCFPFRLPITTEINVIPIPCPSFALSPELPQQPRYPVVIPTPPELPPIVLPKLPVNILIKNPIIPKPTGSITLPDQTMIALRCPPMMKCVRPEKDSASGRTLSSVTAILSFLLGSLTRFLRETNRQDLFSVLNRAEETLIPDSLLVFPTLCVQSIIAERVVPNIVKKEENVKILMSPIFPFQLASPVFYKK